MCGIIASCTLATLLLAVARADLHTDHSGHEHNHEGVMSGRELAFSNADFAFGLYKTLNAKVAAGKNIFFSPLGISSALSMLSAGARGETHEQLFSALGYGAHSQREVNKAYQHLFQKLHHRENDLELFLGNAAAVRTGFSPLKRFVMEIENSFSGKIFNVNFTKPTEAAAEINRFIAAKTQDMIKDQVKDLDPDMALVLINYISFNGEWMKHFDGNLTEKANFHVDNNTTVEVDMMMRTGRYDLYHDAENHATVIMLPYKGNASMMIVLPDEDKMTEVEGLICKRHLKHWRHSVYRSSVNLYLPKFHISTKVDLENSLKEMGISDAFENNADFSGMSEEVKLKVSKVSHQAVLKVFEVGTKAAATTTMEIMPMSLPDVMRLDRPFLVFILDNPTKSILFMGKINNPNLI